MARENQGLQISLIVFVTLTLFLGVATYFLYSKYAEAAAEAKKNAESDSANKALFLAKDTDMKSLMRMIGVSDKDKVDSMQDKFNDEMKKYGGGFPEDARFYSPLLEKMQKTIDDRNKELAEVQAKIPKLKEEYEEFKANRDQQVQKFKEERDKAVQDLAAQQTKFKNDYDQKNQDALALLTNKEDQRKKLEGNVNKVKDELKTAGETIKLLGVQVDGLIKKSEKETVRKVETPDGEVTRVDQRTRMVWINLGRADALMRQVTFSVYPADMSDMTTKGIKGKIEITQVLDEHLSEARILEDFISDPIVPGDKIDTVMWSPNERRHFALAGLMDIDHDGKSDLDALMNIIRINGGVVDCYIPDKGKNKNKVVGRVNLNTNCLILGLAPNEKGDPAQLEAYTKIYDEAKQLRLPTMQLPEMLQSMGWKNLAPVIRFGSGANPDDFRAKPEEGVQKKPMGEDTFKEREPPEKAPPSAYYRF